MDVQWEGNRLLAAASSGIWSYIHSQHFIVLSSSGCLVSLLAHIAALAVQSSLQRHAWQTMQMPSADLLRPHLLILLDMNVVVRTLHPNLVVWHLDAVTKLVVLSSARGEEQ